MIKSLTLIILCFWITASFAQKNLYNTKEDILFDKVTSIKFVLDSMHECVTAFDSANKQLWMADLWGATLAFLHPKNESESLYLSISYFIDTISLGEKFLPFQTETNCYGMIEKQNGKISFYGCE